MIEKLIEESMPFKPFHPQRHFGKEVLLIALLVSGSISTPWDPGFWAT